MSFITDVGKFKKKKKWRRPNKTNKKNEWLKAYLSTVTILYVLSFYATLTPLDFKKVPFTQFQTRMSHKKFQLCQVQRSDFVW